MKQLLIAPILGISITGIFAAVAFTYIGGWGLLTFANLGDRFNK